MRFLLPFGNTQTRGRNLRLDIPFTFSHFVILNPLNSPELSDHSTSTRLTTAPRGPTWQNRISSSNRVLSPSARTSTLPSGRFLTQPRIPRRLARSVISLLKNTPCTKPVIRILARASIYWRWMSDAFLSCFTTRGTVVPKKKVTRLWGEG
jgi:hypothetical protein